MKEMTMCGRVCVCVPLCVCVCVRVCMRREHFDAVIECAFSRADAKQE
jgi:hypothetical protein